MTPLYDVNMNHPCDDPAFEASLQAAYRATDAIFERNREQIDQLTSGVFDNIAANALLPENRMFDRALSMENETIERLLSAATANYPNISDVLTGSFMPTIDFAGMAGISEMAGLSDMTSRANDTLISSIGDFSELNRAFTDVITSNFDTSSVHRLIGLALTELEIEDVAESIDELLEVVPLVNDGATVEEKLERVVSYCAANPVKTVGAPIILGIMLINFCAGTPETAKFVESSTIIAFLYSAVVLLTHVANSPQPE